jgi:hypothetical protein
MFGIDVALASVSLQVPSGAQEDFGRICLKTAQLPTGFRVSDLFELHREAKNGPFELRRTGPRASEFPPL